MSSQERLNLMLKIGIDAKEVQSLVGCSQSYAYKLMKICREEFNGRAGVMSNKITPTSLCKALGTTIEDELHKLKVLDV